MAVEIIPADERGQFLITDQMLMDAGATTMGAFEVLLRNEARRRGLDLRIEEDVATRDIIVRWRPGHQPTEQ